MILYLKLLWLLSNFIYLKNKIRLVILPCVFIAVTKKHWNVGSSYKSVHMTMHSQAPNDYDKIYYYFKINKSNHIQ